MLIGGFDNIWTLRLTQKLRFGFESRDGFARIVDRKNLNQTDWANSWDLPYEKLSRDFARSRARIHDSTTGQPVIIAAGIGEEGTEAAGEILYNPVYLDSLLAKVPPNWEHLEYGGGDRDTSHRRAFRPAGRSGSGNLVTTGHTPKTTLTALQQLPEACLNAGLCLICCDEDSIAGRPWGPSPPGEAIKARNKAGASAIAPVWRASRPLLMRGERERLRACASYLALAFCAAQRLRCASAIRLRASALNMRRFFPSLAAFAAFLVLRPVTLAATLPVLASRERTCCEACDFGVD